jgi:hypothetical protein
VPRPAAGFRLISGVVYEVIGGERRPAANAYVAYDPLDGFPLAMTRTDTEGRFLLCGIPSDVSAVIDTSVNSHYAYVAVPPGPDASIEIVVR